MEDLSLPDGVKYEVPYVPVVSKCSKCGKKYRIDTEHVSSVSAIQLFQHCPDDEGTHMLGPLLGVYEERDGKWVTRE